MSIRHKTNKNKYQEDKTDETYRLPNGAKSALPIYYKNKIYTDEEKQKLWLNKLDTKGQELSKDRKSTRLNSSHSAKSRMPSSA